MFRPSISRIPLLDQILFGFVLFSVLWRGGKGLESVWILVGVAGILTIHSFIIERGQIEDGRERKLSLVVWGSVIAFIGWTALSYYFSSTANYGLDEVLRDGALVLIFLWTMRRAMGTDAEMFIQRFAMTITMATILAIAFGVLVYAMQPVNRFVGTFFDYRFHTDYWPNAWAQYLLLAWPMMLLLMKGKTGRTMLAGYGILGITFGALLLSYSRGAMIALGGQIFLLGIWHGFPYKSLRVGSRTIFSISMICLVAFGMFLSVNILRGNYHPVQSVTEKITFTADEGGSSVSERAQFWHQSMELIQQKPLYGWGPYSFRFIHQRLQTGVLQTSDHPHNLFLKLAVERGVPAAIFFLLLLFYILFPVGKLLVADSWLLGNVQQPSISPSEWPTNRAGNYQLFFCIAVLGVLAHNLIDYNLQFVGIALPFWMMLGMLAVMRAERIDKTVILNKKCIQILELIITAILLLIALYEGMYLITSSVGRHAEARGDSVRALRWYDRSTGEYFSRDMHVSLALLATKNGDTDRAKEAITTYLGLNAQDPRGWRLQGDIARQNGDANTAMVAYQKAYDLGRWNDLSITLALAETLSGKDHKDLEKLRPEIDILLNAFADGITRNAHFIALSHNAEDAIALAGLLAAAFPKDAPRYEVLAAKMDYAMRMERTKVRSRPAGYLW